MALRGTVGFEDDLGVFGGELELADFLGLEVFPAFCWGDFAGEGLFAVGEELPGISGVFGVDGPFPFDVVFARAVEDNDHSARLLRRATNRGRPNRACI